MEPLMFIVDAMCAIAIIVLFFAGMDLLLRLGRAFFQ